MDNKALIEKFYQAFAAADAETMVGCYHQDIEFEDPAFGKLNGETAQNMWRMLIERGKGAIKITYSDVIADEKSGIANWVAEYKFGPQARPVINRITAHFEFKDGKIVKHTDHFDVWNWAGQAIGWMGYALGWSSFLKSKIQQNSNQLLQAYIARKQAV